MKIKGGPDIIQDSLLFHVDASSYRSYPVTGSYWLDISGNGNHFQIFGNPTWDMEGFQLDENLDHFRCYTVDNNENSFTVEAFYKFHQTDTAYGPIITRWQTGGNTNNEFFLGNNDGSAGPGYVRFGVDNSTGTVFDAVASTLSTTNVWYHQVGVFDGTNTYVYLNTELVGTSTTLTGSPNVYRNQPVAIGAFGDSMESGSQLYEAAIKIRSARMYNRVLTHSEIIQNFNAQKHRYGL